MPSSHYKTALVTGASSGIGAAAVAHLTRAGLEVHAIARSADKLQRLADETGCHVHAIDVSDVEALTPLAQSRDFDVLINSAGVDRPGSLPTADADGVDELIDVNLRATLHLCRLLLPGMMARDRGHIINISSIAGAYNFGGNTTYHTTKAAVSMLSRQLRVDAFGKRVRVTEICPGRVATDIFAHVHGDPDTAYATYIEGFELPIADDIADAIDFVLCAPLAVNVGHMEITPTLQVPGGLQTARPQRTS